MNSYAYQRWEIGEAPQHEAVHAAADSMNSERPERLNRYLHEVGQLAVRNGFARFDGGGLGEKADYSDTDAFVHFHPFANGYSKHMLVRGEMIRRTLRAYGGYHDPRGREIPVISIPAPKKASELPLSPERYANVAAGSFWLVGRAMLEGVARHGYERILPVGYSQGADIALSVAASGADDLDIVGVGAAEVIRTKPRGYFGLMRDMGKAGMAEVKKAAEASEIDALTVKVNPLDLVQGVRAAKKVGILSGFRLQRSSYDLALALQREGVRKVTLAYGSESAMCDGRNLTLQLMLALDNERVKAQDKLAELIEIRGGNHAWGDNLRLLSQFCLYAVSRA